MLMVVHFPIKRSTLLIPSRAMAAILDHFSDRLRAGAKADLLALAKVTFIKSRTARVFYDNGFKTVALLANADPKELVPILMQVCLVHSCTELS